MNLSAPTQITFIIAAILAIVGLLGRLAVITAVAPNAFWLAFAGWVVLTAGCLMKDI